MEELKECPFCGSAKDLTVMQDDCDKKLWTILCSNPPCYRRVGFWDSEEETIEAWNFRGSKRDAEADADIMNGNVFGPFSSIDEMKASFEQWKKDNPKTQHKETRVTKMDEEAR